MIERELIIILIIFLLSVYILSRLSQKDTPNMTDEHFTSQSNEALQYLSSVYGTFLTVMFL